MNEEEILRKLDSVYKHNQYNKLKRENMQKDQKIKELSKESRRIMKSYNDKSKKIIEEKDKKIEELENQFNEARKKAEEYKRIIDSIPDFIVKMFYKK